MFWYNDAPPTTSSGSLEFNCTVGHFLWLRVVVPTDFSAFKVQKTSSAIYLLLFVIFSVLDDPDNITEFLADFSFQFSFLQSQTNERRTLAQMMQIQRHLTKLILTILTCSCHVSQRMFCLWIKAFSVHWSHLLRSRNIQITELSKENRNFDVISYLHCRYFSITVFQYLE